MDDDKLLGSIGAGTANCSTKTLYHGVVIILGVACTSRMTYLKDKL
jgi:hypothetical protein